MRSFLLLSIQALLFITASAAPKSSRYVQHEVVETRVDIPHKWIRRSKADADVILPVRIGLTQNNLQFADLFIMQVAGPDSPTYGQHWSSKEVAETFAPSQETVDAVKSWLHDAGISPDRILLSSSRGWLAFNSEVQEVENLLKTEYHVYEHEDSGIQQFVSGTYSIPVAIRKHVDFITPTLHFDRAAVANKIGKSRTRTSHSLVTRDDNLAQNNNAARPVSMVKAGKVIASAGQPDDLSTCDSEITLDCLRALYGIPNVNITAANNSLGIVEYSYESYRQSDLDKFFATYAPSMVGQSPVLDSIDGGALYTETNSSGVNLESNLDFQYAMGLAQHGTVTLYQTGDAIVGSSFNLFLDAIDGSYCTYEGGDDPTYDPVYPHDAPGYTGPKTCGAFAPTHVISTSYGINELSFSAAYERRQCNEYMKLALLGITVIFSSGDYGVAGNGGVCTGAHGIQDVFLPEFPASCPYVLAVGATEVASGNNITQPEIAAITEISSGGGFSNVYPMGSWQEATLSNWWAEHNPGYSFQQFNNSQRTRGFPDVSANGVNFVVASDDEFGLVYGTSASAPTFAALITHINDELLNAGKKPVGFISPMLYAHPEVMTDITSGNNPGCSTDGFEAVEGWDPVTGLGTPNYQKMLDLFMSLQ